MRTLLRSWKGFVCRLIPQSGCHPGTRFPIHDMVTQGCLPGPQGINPRPAGLTEDRGHFLLGCGEAARAKTQGRTFRGRSDGGFGEVGWGPCKGNDELINRHGAAS